MARPATPNIAAVVTARFERRMPTSSRPAARIARNPAASPPSRVTVGPFGSLTAQSRPGGQSVSEVVAAASRFRLQKSFSSSDERPAAAKTMKATARARRGFRRRA
jgi:hypothetical protein